MQNGGVITVIGLAAAATDVQSSATRSFLMCRRIGRPESFRSHSVKPFHRLRVRCRRSLTGKALTGRWFRIRRRLEMTSPITIHNEHFFFAVRSFTGRRHLIESGITPETVTAAAGEGWRAFGWSTVRHGSYYVLAVIVKPVQCGFRSSTELYFASRCPAGRRSVASTSNSAISRLLQFAIFGDTAPDFSISVSSEPTASRTVTASFFRYYCVTNFCCCDC
jgi:hypothetical protein